MKILHISTQNSYTSGWNYHENLLTKHHRLLGHDVTLIVPNKEHNRENPNEIIDCQEGVFYDENSVKIIRRQLRYKIFLFLKIPFENIDNDIEQERPDLIFVHGMVSFSIKQVAKYIKNHNSCIAFCDNHLDIENCNTKSLRTRIRLFVLKMRNKLSMKYFRICYGVTPGRAEFAIKYLGAPKYKTKLSIMGGDDSIINSISLEDIPKKPTIFVTGGKLNKKKGIIEIMNSFSRSATNSKLLIFGTIAKDIESDFNDIICKDPRIKFLGWKNDSDIYKLFIKSHVALFNNSHSVLWESALACGIPIVASIKNGFNHLSKHNNSWNLNTDGNLDEAIKAFCNNEKNALEKITNAKKYKNQYSYSTIAQHIIDDYYKIKSGER